MNRPGDQWPRGDLIAWAALLWTLGALAFLVARVV